MLIINPATLRHLHETVHRLARGLWFAYSGELVQDGTTIDSDNPGGWLEDAARLLLGGQLDHVTNLEGAEALQALRTIDDAAALKILVTPDGVMGCEAGSLVLVSPPSGESPSPIETKEV